MGVVGDQTNAAHKLNKIAYVTGITCWRTPDKKAIGAIRLALSSGTPTTLGNAGLTTNPGVDATGFSIPASADVVEVRMWYSTALDINKKAQLGRIYLKLTSGDEFHCGEASRPFEAYDMRLVDPDEDGAAIGSMLTGAVAMSSNISNNQPGSITALNWLILKRVASGDVSVSPKETYDPKKALSTEVPPFTDLDKYKISNAGEVARTMMLNVPACPPNMISLSMQATRSP